MYLWDYKQAEEIRELPDRELLLCLMDSGLMKAPKCKNCFNEMRPRFRDQRGNAWICRRKGKDCWSISMKNSSFFSNSNIKLKEQIIITICWLNGLDLATVCGKCKVSSHSIEEYIGVLRAVCVQYWKNILLGGNETVVELATAEINVNYELEAGESVSEDVRLIAAIERLDGGEAVAGLLPSTSSEYIDDFLFFKVIPGSFLVCDEWRNSNVGGINNNLFSRSSNEEFQEAVATICGQAAEEDMEIRRNLLSIVNLENLRSLQKENKNGKASKNESVTVEDFVEFVTPTISDGFGLDQRGREEILAESVVRFNGRHNLHEFFWNLVVEQYDVIEDLRNSATMLSVFTTNDGTMMRAT
ncbi:unnamed protein product [Caenorhabditis auriculariae]|uniref:Uncharacterized protein n=1 Tax=Caenorhabditis auriculariae TaxID=2777116 RepID=A0A8S1GVS2_9PELO|nr:unnamed protein product [Caenorhabditis auriculariae]